MTTDQLVERGAERLEELAEQAAQRGGVAAKLADPLAEDAEFLRKLKPSLIKARAKGRAPTDSKPRDSQTRAEPAPQPEARRSSPPPRPEPPRKEKPERNGSGGPNPFVVAGAALLAGVFLAKWLDWRGHAHPRF